MFLSVTHAVYVGGAGSVIIGGLYWRRGSTLGAWASMITGGFIAVTGFLCNNVIWPYVVPSLRQSYANVPWLKALPDKFPLNGNQLTFTAADGIERVQQSNH